MLFWFCFNHELNICEAFKEIDPFKEVNTPLFLQNAELIFGNQIFGCLYPAVVLNTKGPAASKLTQPIFNT